MLTITDLKEMLGANEVRADDDEFGFKEPVEGLRHLTGGIYNEMLQSVGKDKILKHLSDYAESKSLKPGKNVCIHFGDYEDPETGTIIKDWFTEYTVIKGTYSE